MKCKNCKKNEALKYSKYSTGEFCSRECARAYSTKNKREEINKKVSEKMLKKSMSDERILRIIEKNNGKYKSGTSVLKTLICESCGDEFYTKNNILYCKECSKINKRIKTLVKLKVVEKNLKNSKKNAIELLKKEYFENKLSMPQIYKKHNIYQRTVWKFLNDNGIKLRDFSRSASLTYKNGKPISSGNNNFHSGYHTTWYGKKVFYRSSYEKRVMDVLDNNKIMYFYEKKRIEYYFDGKERTYISDFYFPEKKTIIETKGKYFQKRDRLKIIEEKKEVEKNDILFFLAGEIEIKKIEKFGIKYLNRVFVGKEIGAKL